MKKGSSVTVKIDAYQQKVSEGSCAFPENLAVQRNTNTTTVDQVDSVDSLKNLKKDQLDQQQPSNADDDPSVVNALALKSLASVLAPTEI